MISTKGLFLVPLTFVNNLVTCCSCKFCELAPFVWIPMKTGPNYRIMLFPSFRRDFSFDIRHLFERDYWCARSGIGVHCLQEVFKNVHQRLWIIYCPEWTVLSYRPGVKWTDRSLDAIMYVLINQYNGNKTLGQNDSCVVMSFNFIKWQKLTLFSPSRIAWESNWIWNSSKK